jgi:hypothetical protein
MRGGLSAFALATSVSGAAVISLTAAPVSADRLFDREPADAPRDLPNMRRVVVVSGVFDGQGEGETV